MKNDTSKDHLLFRLMPLLPKWIIQIKQLLVLNFKNCDDSFSSQPWKSYCRIFKSSHFERDKMKFHIALSQHKGVLKNLLSMNEQKQKQNLCLCVRERERERGRGFRLDRKSCSNLYANGKATRQGS